MSLSSIHFLVFTLLVLISYYLIPQKHRWIVLLCASFGYYIILCYKYIIFILTTIISTFGGGIWLYNVICHSKQTLKENKSKWSAEERKAFKQRAETKKKLVVAVILLFNFGILGFLKYFNFLANSVSGLLNILGIPLEAPQLGLILPLGISFYTFQSMGYIIDIYREKFEPERNIAKFALFVSFFPQIIQGPISLYSDLSPQLYNGSPLKFKNIKMGAELILYGFFKKLVIADRAVILITTITGEFENFRGTYVLLAALTYALQLYADFSGGIDISRGVAEMLGIMLPENFRRPYFARNISDYWHRWHITLGAWLRNYLFYPIAMSKMFQTLGKKTKKVFGKQIGKVLPTSIASLITFIVIGIWHGANWKYVAFGFWNGAIIMISTLLEPYFDTWLNYLKIKRDNFFFILFQMVRTFFIVLVGYYFDIAANLSGAVSMMVSSVMDFHFADLLNRKIMAGFGLNKMDYFVILFGAVVIFIASFASEKTGRSARELLGDMPYLIQCMVLLAGIACVALMGIYGPGYNPAEFVYMQF